MNVIRDELVVTLQIIAGDVKIDRAIFVLGMFANDPVAEEVRKMVEETREKERRKARRARSRKKAKA